MSANNGRAVRDGDREAVRLGLLVRPGEQHELAREASVPMRLDRRNLHRLVLESVEAVLVAEEELQWRDDGGKTDRHADHGVAVLEMLARTESTTNNVVRYAAVTMWGRR